MTSDGSGLHPDSGHDSSGLMGVLPGVRSRDGRAAIASLRQQSDDLAAAGDWTATAEDVNRRLLGVEPVAAIAMTRLAKCLRERGDAEGAESIYAALLALEPGNVIAANFLRSVQRGRQQAATEEHEATTAARRREFAQRPGVRAISEPGLKAVQEALRILPDAAGTYLEGDLLTNVFLTVLDLNMQASTVSKAIRNYRRYRSAEVWTLEELQSILDTYPDDPEGNRQVAEYLWANRYAKRAQWMRRLIEWLVANDLGSNERLRAWAGTAEYERDFKDQIKGLDLAAFNGLIIRLGMDTVKPDVLLHEFVETIVGHRVSDEELLRVMHLVAERLNRSPVQLDWSIREQQRGRAGIL